MNPQQQLPVDYLDQIAPQRQKASLFRARPILFVAVGLGLVAVIIAASVISSTIANSGKEPWTRLTARLDATRAITDSTDGKIKSSTLRSLNSEVELFLTNTARDLEAPLSALEITNDSIPESILAEESAEPALTRLEDARLNAVYDRTYAREMTYQLALVLSQLQEAYSVSRVPENQELLNTSYESLQQTHDSFSEYSAAND